MTIDSHCHLGKEDYEISVRQIIKEAKAVGIKYIMGVACEAKEWPELINLLQEKIVYGSIGLHPEYANYDYTFDLRKMQSLFNKNPKLLAVGEIGLDYHEVPNTINEQKELFFEQIKIAHKIKKPIMIHTRDAEEDTIRILKEAKNKGLLMYNGVIHCFTGTKKFAKELLNMGFYISASGIITFKSAENLRNIFMEIPLDKLLVETDSPWLAPTPYRGKKNKPIYVQKTLEKLAEIKGVSVSEMEKVTDSNFSKIYFGR